MPTELSQQEINTLADAEWVDNALEEYKGFAIVCMKGNYRGEERYIARAGTFKEHNQFEKDIKFSTFKPTQNEAMRELFYLIDIYRGSSHV